MKFEYPGFLWAALLLLIPIIIHLFHFRRYKKVRFPHVQFLQNIQRETQSVKKIKNLLVLIARLCALLFLVFAFAQPFKPSKGAQSQSNKDAVSVYVDNSFSMEANGSEGPIFEEAKEKAREIINAHDNSAQFLIIDNTGKGAARLVSKDDAISRIDELQIAHVPQDLTETMKLIRFGLEKSGAGTKQIYLVSDFQQPEKAYNPLSFLDSSFQITAVSVKPSAGRNISIDTAWLENPQLQLNEAFTLNVQVTNRGEDEVMESTVALDVNGVRKSAAGFDLLPGESKTLSMGVTLTQTGWLKGVLSIEDEDLTFDNEYFITFNIKNQVRILAVHGEASNPYLDKLFGSDPYFKLTNSNQGNLDLSEMRKSDLLIINEVESLGNGIVGAIKSYVDEGGTVFIVPKVGAKPEYLSNLLSILGLPIINLERTSPLSVSRVDINHPLFAKVFEKIPNNPDYPKVTKNYALTGGTGSNTLMRLSNEDPFLVGTSIGNGNAYLLASPLREDWSNFQQHALFVPALLKMSMSRSSDFPMSYTISRQNLFRSVADGSHMQGDVKLKSTDQEWMPVLNQQGLVSYVDAGDDQMSAGNIQMNYRDSLLQIVSFNYHRRESESKHFDKAGLESIFSGSVFYFNDDKAIQLSKTINNQRLGKRFWKLCVILSLIFLAIEILLLRLWPNRSILSKSPKTSTVAHE